MTIEALIDELENLKNQLGDQTQVRFASQPAWPFEYSIRGVHHVRHDEVDEEDEDVNVVYLEEGTQLGYLPRAAKDILCW